MNKPEMIIFKEVDKSFLDLYDKITMNVEVRSEYKVKRINNGLCCRKWICMLIM